MDDVGMTEILNFPLSLSLCIWNSIYVNHNYKSLKYINIFILQPFKKLAS
jgi:hypothetical protein